MRARACKCASVCVGACVRVCVRACVCACVRAYVCVHVREQDLLSRANWEELAPDDGAGTRVCVGRTDVFAEMAWWVAVIDASPFAALSHL